ncbi:hypothetical protein CDD81_4645 [Ophiocordyceps australis]|uniref:Uncharacterized protein n=1 Tax=Ophiocordyceps australis TaxID=1399860 RepID=A0A2C5YBT4_9HYPO|nr:hypothetical protein CDD81_4645 [Ophiocordyceps australis]
MAARKGVESAAEYGCRTGCFRDHQGQQFSLQRQLKCLQDTAVATAPKRLIEQSGLQSCPIPKPVIDVDGAAEEQKPLMDIFGDTPSPSPWSLELIPGLTAIKELLVPVDELDLGSSLELDLLELADEVFMKQSWSLSSTWLPISPVHTECDEGLEFPRKCRKLHSLLRRELELEQISTSEQSEAFMANEFALQSAAGRPACSSILCMPPTRVEAVTPPISPISEACSPFIPGSDAVVIDLTSEPSSPPLARVDQLQRNVLQGQIDSDIEASWSLIASPPVKANATLPCHHRAMQDAHIDVPLACLSSDSVPLPNIFENANLGPSILGTQELDSTLHAEQGPLEHVLLGLANARASYAAKLVAQEKLDPADSLSRLSVPIMDFHFPPPEWMQNIQSARKQLSWLQNSYIFDFAPLYPKDALLDSSLKWTPVPRGKGRVSTSEHLEPNQYCEALLGIESRPDLLTGMNSASDSRTLTVLDLTADEEVEELESVPIAHDLLGHSTASSSPYFAPHSAQTKMDQSLESLCRSMRRKAEDYNAGQSPAPKDTSATSKLISDFMHLRAIKRPRLCHPIVAQIGQAPTPLQNISHSAKQLERADEVPKQIPAPSPPVKMPQRVGPCIVSLALDRHIIRQLSQFWPAHLLFDHDYEQYSTCERVREEDMLLPATFDLPLTVEADITLSLDTGVIVTTLLKVRQRPLPGSKAQAPMRERIRELSAKYEKLIVLVSENNPAGEFIASQELSEDTVYTDFVGFTNSLNAQVAVHLIPGNKETLGKWILSFMSRHSVCSAATQDFVTLKKETAWELFLRRAGFNIMAARVIANKLLDEYGNSGLAQFFKMSTGEKLARYGRLLGGHRVLSSCCKALYKHGI